MAVALRRASHLALAIGIAALPIGIGAGMASHGSATAALDGALANRASGQAQLLQDHFARARSIDLITAQNPAFAAFFAQPGDRTSKLNRGGENIKQINAALGYLETLYPDAIGEACFIDRNGHEIARVVRGEVAPIDDLSLQEAKAPFFTPTFALAHGAVYHAAPYESPDTGEWVVSNSTLMPTADGTKKAIVHFETTIESFRKTAVAGSQFPVVVVDGHSGRVVIDSRYPQLRDQPLGRPHDDRFEGLRDASRADATLNIDGKRASYQQLEQVEGNANEWLVVAVAPHKLGFMYGVGTWPVITVLGALVMLIIGFVGQQFAQRDLVEQASTDQLTGLFNRRKLKADLADAVRDASLERQTLLLMFDLNGFKDYNDAFGHSAGDALLTRLGKNLQDAMAGRGSAYRLGGDEFCVVAPIGPDGMDPTIAAASAALRERGQGFEIDASYGSVLIPIESTDPAEALHIVDQRMYAQKSDGRRSADKQTKDVLLRALYERHPDLSDRFRMVADLADTVAERMGMVGEERKLVRQAAELHDIGKVGVPDDILDKAGELTPDEWAFVRRHSVIGERILAAAPALSYAAKLVRSANECFDGTGYPDRLAGDAIPLGSRIIAVCDAFVALTSYRPFARPVAAAGALEELRRCAGSQFDPQVVAVFASVIGDAGHEQSRFDAIVRGLDTIPLQSLD